MTKAEEYINSKSPNGILVHIDYALTAIKIAIIEEKLDSWEHSLSSLLEHGSNSGRQCEMMEDIIRVYKSEIETLMK
jgi:hypothetical protein